MKSGNSRDERRRKESAKKDRRIERGVSVGGG
jgi:hypothetical protein